MIALSELKSVLIELEERITQAEIDSMFQKVNASTNGFISYEDLVKMMMPEEGESTSV